MQSDVLDRPQLTTTTPRRRRRRRILVIAVAVLAFAAFGVWRGLQPEYPCSPGWHKVPVPITAHVGVCLDRDNNCLPVPHADQDGQHTFSMGSCVADPRGRG